MGINGLPAVIQSIAGEYATKSYEFSRFAGMSVAIDASLMVHQTAIALRGTGRDMRNDNGQLTSHLYGTFFKILIFLQHGMKPIFVFDGKAPHIKRDTIRRRSEKKKVANENLESLVDSEDEEYIKNFKQTFSPSKSDYRELKIMLDLMGIPYIDAPEEADVVCAWLASRIDTNTGKRYVKGVCSDDSDMLTFGAQYLFKDMLKFMSKNKQVKVISLTKALTKMQLSMHQFVDMCVLLGCDYCKKIKGVGKKGAYDLIRSHDTLENVIKYLKKTGKYIVDSDSGDTSDPDNTHNNVETQSANEICMISASNYFKTAVQKLDSNPKFKITNDNITLKQFQYDELMDFMCVKHNFDIDRMLKAVGRLKEYYAKMNVTQSNNAQVHKILQPRSENYTFKSINDRDFEFLPSDDDSVSVSVTVKKTAKKSSKLVQKGGWKIPPKKYNIKKYSSTSDSGDDNSNEHDSSGSISAS